jgi:predicted flap endonuclease-1-like 5' DNA nuclease/predicted  nucleic acid-binding Zn-ribbon protein
MPEITATHIALLAGALIIGVILGWIVRGNRTAGEKTAINAGWQEQLEAQRNEHERLMEQNKSLMDQNSQFQASNNDAKMRASELSSALKEAFERRDELQRQIKDIRGNLEVAVTQRDQLQSDIANRVSKADNESASIKDRDDKIFDLSRELENWQDRLPPLIERYQKRNAEAETLEKELADAHERIIALESMLSSDETRVEPVDPEAMTDGLDASNDPVEETSGVAVEIDEAEDLEDLDSLLNGDARDNLKLIKGVGPAIEKTLNEMGILRFSQIAEMSEYDIDRVAHRMKGFRSRIYREDWIGQARDLHDQKTSD